jgi:preprotein translocase subunit YajC
VLKERIIWVVALLVVAGAGFFGGERVGVGIGQQDRAQASQQFFANRGGGPGGQGGQGGFAGRGVNGTVSAINGTTITVTVRDGTTTNVQLAADGKVRKQVDGQLTDIKTGDRITAIGALSGDVFQATTIQVGALGGPGGPVAPGGPGGPGGTTPAQP